MKNYAIIESNSGYIWGVEKADSAIAACAAVDRECGADRHSGTYVEVGVERLRDTESVYDVRIAPDEFQVDDGQSSESIDAVGQMPRAGVFSWACRK